MPTLATAQVVYIDWTAAGTAIVAVVGAVSVAAVAVIGAVAKARRESKAATDEIHDAVNGNATAAAERLDELHERVEELLQALGDAVHRAERAEEELADERS